MIMIDPRESIKNKDKKNDIILLGPVKAIPTSSTVWAKISEIYDLPRIK